MKYLTALLHHSGDRPHTNIIRDLSDMVCQGPDSLIVVSIRSGASNCVGRLILCAQGLFAVCRRTNGSKIGVPSAIAFLVSKPSFQLLHGMHASASLTISTATYPASLETLQRCPNCLRYILYLSQYAYIHNMYHLHTEFRAIDCTCRSPVFETSSRYHVTMLGRNVIGHNLSDRPEHRCKSDSRF